jgi:alpha-mannosidase
MQFAFEGCYTNIAKVKEGNRKSESALYAAEWLSSLRKLLGGGYEADALRDAWETVLFNEFHDILPGSAIHESNADAVADYKRAIGLAERVRDAAIRSLADEIRFVEGLGQPVAVFNPQPRRRSALVEAEIFTHESPAAAALAGWGDFYGSDRITAVDRGQGSLPTVLLRDTEGGAIPAQIVWGKNFPPGWRSRIRFVADLPAGGYRSFYVDASNPGQGGSVQVNGGEFETDFFRVGFDMKTGDIVRLHDKRTGFEYAAGTGGLNRLRVYKEAPHDMSAWSLGPVSSVEDVNRVERVSVTANGPVQACVEAVKSWGRSKFIQRTIVYRSYPRIDFELEAHWFEQGDDRTDAPMLRVVFPFSLKNARFDCHVPFDVVSRPTTGREVPAQQWVDVSDGRNGIALMNQTKYGHSYGDGELRLTLLRSAYNPDVYPDQGLHRIRYALFPHAGDWKNGVWAEAEAFNVPPVAAEPPSFALGRAHATRPEQSELVSLDPADVALSGIKQAEDGTGIVVRLVDVTGKGGPATLALPVRVKSAKRLDLIERPLKEAEIPAVRDRTVTVVLKPHEVATLGIHTAE